MIRTVLEWLYIMLKHRSVTKEFWTKALRTACHLRTSIISRWLLSDNGTVLCLWSELVIVWENYQSRLVDIFV